jgi:hypothetical protein
MEDGNLANLYNKDTRDYTRHVRCLRDAQDSQVSLFLAIVAHEHVTCVFVTSGDYQDSLSFAYTKRVTVEAVDKR